MNRAEVVDPAPGAQDRVGERGPFDAGGTGTGTGHGSVRMAPSPNRITEPTVVFAVKLTLAQRQRLRTLGDGAWVRERIDRARDEPLAVLVADTEADLRCYRLGRVPRCLNEENAASWSILEAILRARGHAQFKVLATAVTGHSPRDHAKLRPEQFVAYCVKRGWLKELGPQD